MGTGAASLVEVIDFKTDAVASMAGLRERHGGQMAAYAQAMAKAFPGARVETVLVSVGLRACDRQVG